MEIDFGKTDVENASGKSQNPEEYARMCTNKTQKDRVRRVRAHDHAPWTRDHTPQTCDHAPREITHLRTCDHRFLSPFSL